MGKRLTIAGRFPGNYISVERYGDMSAGSVANLSEPVIISVFLQRMQECYAIT